MTLDIPESASYAFQGKISAKPPMLVAASGDILTLENPLNGQRVEVIDALGGAAVSALGHGDPEIIQAMKDAAESSFYSYSPMISNYAAEELSKFICDNSPPQAFRAALFTGSGSELSENALKIIRQYFLELGQPQRKKFIGRKQLYHGYTLGAFSIGDGYRKLPFVDLLMPADNCPKVSQCYPYRHMRDGESLEVYKDRLLQELEDTFIAAGPDTVAAVIFETVSGTTYGTALPVPGYLDGTKKLCEKYGALFMLDEVMCGLGRCSGPNLGLHAWEQFMNPSNGPDIQTIGKVLGCGFVTIAGVLVSPKVYQAYINGLNAILGGQTYHQHAFNCQVALAVQQRIKRDGLIKNIYTLGNYIGESLRLELSASPIVGEVRGTGGFWSVEFVENKITKSPFDIALKVGPRVGEVCLENGVNVMGLSCTIDGVNGDHITFAPNYNITSDAAEKIIDRISKSISMVAKELGKC